jgi:hypothetical protein
LAWRSFDAIVVGLVDNIILSQEGADLLNARRMANQLANAKRGVPINRDFYDRVRANA